jgi:hypothetical protein
MVKKLCGALAVALLALGTSAHAGVPPASTCKDAKAKATGTKALGLLKAFGANAKVVNTTKLSADISKAQSKFTKGFTKAEFTGAGASKGCTIIEDSDEVEAKVDALVLDVLDELEQPPVAPVELLGALGPNTPGNFIYNLSTGLPGANSACNTNFPGTHACEYSELLIAEAAGDLDGLQDTTAATVTSFWVIDNSNNADLNQCNDDAATPGFPVPGANWGYATAHTPSKGQRVDLNNPAGTLGPIQPPQSCSLSRWVGCCL